MTQIGKNGYKSIYHVLLWIGIFSLIMIGFMEYGYVVGGRPFGNYKVYTGLVPWCAWIVMTYLATRPKWFATAYNVGDMFKVHRALGLASVIVIAFHWYIYYGKAAKSVLGWWGGYIALVAFAIATIAGILYLTPKLRKVSASGRKLGIWLHRFNLVAIIAVAFHINGFKRLANMMPFTPLFDIITVLIVVYYAYWIVKQK